MPTRANTPSIHASEYQHRREALLKALRGSIGLIVAGEHDPHLEHAYRPHAHFEYLTGLTTEPGAMLLLDPGHPVAERRTILLLKPLNPELEKWDGYRGEIGSVLRDQYGFPTIHRTNYLARFLLEAVRRSKRLACLHPLAAHTAPVSPDLAIFRESAARVPGAVIEDRSELLAVMRSVKSRAEVAMIERAIDITSIGFDAVMRSVRPGMSEFDVQESIEHTYRTSGARTLAFGTIAGGGFNSTVLHYRANDQPLSAGDVICVDSGARFGGYSADITRTLPVGGKFSRRQREIYDVVLAALRAAVRATRPGVAIAQIDSAARKVIAKAGFGDYFIHGIGHHLGLETHDVSPDAPLKAGAVITIEPGIYIPRDRIGIRIEDDVLVTPRGARVLSEEIPREAEDIERAMRRGKARS